MAHLGYATVGSNGLEQAKSFYDALFGSFGIIPAFDHPTGGRIYGKGGEFFFGVLGPFDKQAATAGNGTMIGFRCDNPKEVDAFHARALSLGARDEGAPGYRAPQFICPISATWTATSSVPMRYCPVLNTGALLVLGSAHKNNGRTACGYPD